MVSTLVCESEGEFTFGLEGGQDVFYFCRSVGSLAGSPNTAPRKGKSPEFPMLCGGASSVSGSGILEIVRWVDIRRIGRDEAEGRTWERSNV